MKPRKSLVSLAVSIGTVFLITGCNKTSENKSKASDTVESTDLPTYQCPTGAEHYVEYPNLGKRNRKVRVIGCRDSAGNRQGRHLKLQLIVSDWTEHKAKHPEDSLAAVMLDYRGMIETIGQQVFNVREHGWYKNDMKHGVWESMVGSGRSVRQLAVREYSNGELVKRDGKRDKTFSLNWKYQFERKKPAIWQETSATPVAGGTFPIVNSSVIGALSPSLERRLKLMKSECKKQFNPAFCDF